MGLPPPLKPPGDALNQLMMMLGGLTPRRYTHISFHFPPGVSELEASHYIQPVINKADDWLKYTGNCWIVWSSKTPTEWYEQFAGIERLKACSILVVKLDLTPQNRAGQFPEWIWDWIHKPRY
jgi:hypothetical protein